MIWRLWIFQKTHFGILSWAGGYGSSCGEKAPAPETISNLWACILGVPSLSIPLCSLSINGIKQCRIASVVSSVALRKCRQIPSVLSSFYLIRIFDTLPCFLETLWMQTVASARTAAVFHGALTFLLSTKSDWGVGQAFLNLEFNSITKYLLLTSSL